MKGAQRDRAQSCREGGMRICEGGLDDGRVLDLLRLHLAGMHENSPPENVFALDLSGLGAEDVTFFTVWRGDTRDCAEFCAPAW